MTSNAGLEINMSPPPLLPTKIWKLSISLESSFDKKQKCKTLIGSVLTSEKFGKNHTIQGQWDLELTTFNFDKKKKKGFSL